jgi:hypothetical protein
MCAVGTVTKKDLGKVFKQVLECVMMLLNVWCSQMCDDEIWERCSKWYQQNTKKNMWERCWNGTSCPARF